MKSTKEVLEHHQQALATANLEEIGKDYTDSSKVLIATLGVHSGKQAILKAFEGFLPVVKGGDFKVKTLLIAGNAVLLVWDFKSPAATVHDGVDTFFIDNGVIEYQTTAFNLIRNS
jgi:ketosteroid isomerase-like protein